MHGEGDNWHCVPTGSGREFSDQSGAEDKKKKKNLNDLQDDIDKKHTNFSLDHGFSHMLISCD